MDKSLKQKLVGAAVLIALAVIFIPMLLDGGKKDDGATMQIDVPQKPVYQIPNRLEQASAPTETVQVPVPPPAAEQPGAAPAPAPTATTTAPARPAAPAAGAASAGTAAAPSKPSTASGQPAPATGVVVTPLTGKPDAPKPEAIAAAPATTQPAATQPSATKPAPATAASAASSGAGFVVQVGSFSKQENAASLKDRLAASGFPAFVEATGAKGKEIYRVKVGPRPSREAADDLRQKLIDNQKIEGIIVTHP